MHFGSKHLFLEVHCTNNKPYVCLKLFICIFQPLKSVRPVNMENLPVNNNNGQSYGYTLYETTITSAGTLDSKNNIRDRALVKTGRQTPV